MFRLWGGNDDRVFYDLLRQQATVNRRAVEEVRALAGDFNNAAAHVKNLEGLLEEAQKLMRQLLEKTASTFLTPLDKEDLERLCLAQAGLVRWVVQAAYRIVYYKVPEPRPELRVLADLVWQMAKTTEDAVGHIGDRSKGPEIRELLATGVRLRLETDRSFLQAVGAWLNEPGTDPLLSIKWRDIYDSIETAQTRFLTIAEHVELILAKYS